MLRYEFTPSAAADLREIHAYIARNNPENARRFIDRVKTACRSLVDAPGKGRARPEFGDSVLSFPFGNYIIFYKLTEEGVSILRVIHGARDFDTLLS